MNLDQVAGHVNIELLESSQQVRFEVAYPRPVAGSVIDVDDQQVQPIVVPAATPRRKGQHTNMDEVALLVNDVDGGLRERLDQEIYAFNVAATGHADGRLLSIAARGDGGELRAGLSGWTWGGCGYVEFLWVRPGDRGSGLGTRLLVTAEREMQRRGCDQVVLSTHSFQAPGFYARFGYTECGRTPGYPRGHDQIHLVKQFS